MSTIILINATDQALHSLSLLHHLIASIAKKTDNISKYYFCSVVMLTILKNAGTNCSNIGDFYELIVLEVSHPFGPFLRRHTSGLRPNICRIPIAMPLQVPQFFKPHLPRRPIHKKAVHIAVMSIHAETTYLMLVRTSS